MISLMFLTFAGVANAAMDIVSHKFEQSIFSIGDMDRQYYDPKYSWANKYYTPVEPDYKLIRKTIHIAGWNSNIPVPVLFSDFWHMAKSVMLSCMAIAVLCAVYIDYKLTGIWYVDLILWRSAYGLGFVVAYNVVFVRQEYREKEKV